MNFFWLTTFTLIALISAASNVAEAQSPPSTGFTNAAVLQEPSGQDLAENYPRAAIEQSVQGSATIECLVDLDATPSCQVTAEAPTGWGFGAAALDISRSFRLAPATRNGVPTRGGIIRRTIRFVVPDAVTGENWSERDRIIYAANPPLDLPVWDEAPNFYSVLDAYPASARRNRVKGRGLLSCTIRTDRRLDCRSLTEMPANHGFAAAAMELAPQFRVAEDDSEFIARHRSEPFLLPIFFGSDLEEMPTSRHFTGLAPMEIPMFAFLRNYPAAARDAGIEGRVVALCTFGQAVPASCRIEEETPSGHGFGQSVLDAMSIEPLLPDRPGLLVGDQVRFTVMFDLP